METVRPLLVQGNEKLSPGVWHFDIPAVKTCPGKSTLCSSRCYATRNRYRYPQVRDRLQWAFEQTKRRDFCDRMVQELYRKGCLLMRWHCAGDVYSPAYGHKLLEIIGRSPHCTFWLYSRSWRVPKIEPVLRAIALMPNTTVYYSADSETKLPVEVPPQVRVAWMQVEEDDDPGGGYDLLFRDHPLRKRVPLHLKSITCPTETPEGKVLGVSCATCGVCWK